MFALCPIILILSRRSLPALVQGNAMTLVMATLLNVILVFQPIKYPLNPFLLTVHAFFMCTRQALVQGFRTCVWSPLPEGWVQTTDPKTGQVSSKQFAGDKKRQGGSFQSEQEGPSVCVPCDQGRLGHVFSGLLFVEKLITVRAVKAGSVPSCLRFMSGS
eukprot:1149421-Pelagomonas_calceolata.AAC.2